MINHFHLFGLRQVYFNLRNRETGQMVFKMTGLYKCVRHPIMLGFVVAFWATPHMTIGHLVFAVGTTAYIFIGIHLEERDLVESHEDDYKIGYTALGRKCTAVLVPVLPNCRACRSSFYGSTEGWPAVAAGEVASSAHVSVEDGLKRARAQPRTNRINRERPTGSPTVAARDCWASFPVPHRHSLQSEVLLHTFSCVRSF